MKIIKTITSIILTSLLIISSTTFASHNKPLKVILDWFANPNHAPLFVAKQQNFFKQQGIKVEFITPADPADSSKFVAAGKADIALTYQPQFMLQVLNGLPLTTIGTLIATPLDCILVLKNGPIDKIEKLKNKKIGYSSAGTGNLILSTILKQHGLNLKDVKLINVHYGLTQALLTKKVDAIKGVMRNFEPLELKLIGKHTRMFFPEDNNMPIYNELIFVANRSHIDDPRFKKFLIAVQKGTLYLINHPKDSWKKFAKIHPELNNTLNKKVWFETLPRFTLRPGLIDKQRYTRYAKFLLQSGYSKNRHLYIHDYVNQLF